MERDEPRWCLIILCYASLSYAAKKIGLWSMFAYSVHKMSLAMCIHKTGNLFIVSAILILPFCISTSYAAPENPAEYNVKYEEATDNIKEKIHNEDMAAQNKQETEDLKEQSKMEKGVAEQEQKQLTAEGED